jgi:PAS domain S-box-containing protein
MADTEEKNTRIIELCKQRTRFLKAVGEATLDGSRQGMYALLEECCRILVQNSRFCLVWMGQRLDGEKEITPIAVADSGDMPDRDCMKLVREVILDMHEENPAALALKTGKPVVVQNVLRQYGTSILGRIARETGFRSCLSWPILCKDQEYGVLTIHANQPACFTEIEQEFVGAVVMDLALTLHSWETTRQLKRERDFNQELVDTVQSLLVSVSPCGEILSMNREAEKVTGYSQQEVTRKYWVDVLLSPEERQQNQRHVSEALKDNNRDVNFQASLLTRNGERRIIDWHGSFRTDIDQGKVGLVLFGIDKTEQIRTDQTLNQVLAKWEHIFNAIQDPALIVSADSVILDVNHATLSAARKSRDEIIGRRLCQILHGSEKNHAACPFEGLVREGKTRILEVELQGLHGQYMLTISPLEPGQGDIRLLVARDLRDAALSRAEQRRAAQRASIGERAAGVAHEINNPINGIINYAQLLLDDLEPENADRELNREILNRIISEGTRIGSIAHKLLDFARGQEVEIAPVAVGELVDICLDLVGHQLKKEGIRIEVNIDSALPEVVCSRQQIEQVLLNIISNARYALNKKYPSGSEKKKIIISADRASHDGKPFIVLRITDLGIGIEHDVRQHLFDPFFSTKPRGEGTGLGLSISHGLVQDNNGFLRVQSEVGEYTTLSIGLPVRAA